MVLETTARPLGPHPYEPDESSLPDRLFQNPDRGIQPRQTDPPSRTGLAQQCDLAAGIEPARTARAVLGAPTRNRTPDLMIRSHLLYPLSYEGVSPTESDIEVAAGIEPACLTLQASASPLGHATVLLRGIEPRTSRSAGGCSIH